ncbi:MAG: tetratricopeptide repeat protein, partial [Bacteroidetes bacterium]
MRSQSFLCGRAWRIAYLCLFLLLPIYAHPKPIQAYEQEIERLSRQGGSQAQLAQAYMELGIAQYEAEMPSRALGSLFTALGIAESIHNRQLVAHIRYRIGVVFYSLGQYYQALEHLHPLLNARFITEEEQVNTLVLIGNIYSGLGHYGRAISYLLEALYKLEHFDISEADIRIRVNYNLGNIYYEDQNYEEALLYYQKSLKMAHEQQALRWQCSIQAALGGVYKQTGKYAQALQHLGRAMELARELQDGNNLGYALLNMGITHGKMGQTELALSEIEEAEKLGVSQENLVLQMHCLKARGELFQQNGKLGQAVSTLRQALAISQSLKLQAGKEHILELLSQAYLQMGRLEKAYQVLRYEMKLKDSLYQGDISRIIDLRRNEYTIRHVEEKLVNERIERAHEQALQRIYWFGAGICLIFLCAILWLNYSRYRLQSKAN